MVVTIQKHSRYKLTGTGKGFMLEYSMPGIDYKMHIPVSSASGYRSMVKRLNTDPGFAQAVYREYSSRALKAKKGKKPSPGKIKKMAAQGAALLKKYLHSSGANRVKGWYKFALSKKQIPIITNNNDYSIGMGLGPIESEGSSYYTNFMFPAPQNGNVKVAASPIEVMAFLKIAAGFGAKEYNSVTGRLSKKSRIWARFLKNVKVKKKSEASILKFPRQAGIINGDAEKELYRETG